MIAVPVLLMALVQLTQALPSVHHEVFEKLKKNGQGSFLVTFKPTDLEDANDPDAMFETVKSKLGNFTINNFISTGKYHEVRGNWVYENVKQHHFNTKEWIKKTFPNANIKSSIPISNSFMLEAGVKDYEKLSKNDKVVEIYPNDGFEIELEKATKNDAWPGRLSQFAAVGPKSGRVQWNIEKIGADQVWNMDSNSGRGQGIVYAIADTGVSYLHPNIKNNYIGLKADGKYDHNYAWFDGVRREIAYNGRVVCGIASREPCDDQGHGTHVTSTAVGADGFGVAPGAKWMACRNMDRGVGSPETYLNCLNFFLAPHDLAGRGADPQKRPHVVGNSYGCPDSEGCSKHAMKAAVEALRAAGIFMSVSAGNDGPNCSTVKDPPALEKSVVSVGATNGKDGLADFSSRGPCMIGGESYRKPDVSAPGVRITAAYPDNTYRALSGTSMASPHVGGSVALILSMCPCLYRNVDGLQDLLEQTAVKLKPPKGATLCGVDQSNSVPNNFFGYGRIDVLSAVRMCRQRCSKSIKRY